MRDKIPNERIDKEIDICCMQETELDLQNPTEILSHNNYDFVPENNTTKSRVCVYIKLGRSTW